MDTYIVTICRRVLYGRILDSLYRLRFGSCLSPCNGRKRCNYNNSGSRIHHLSMNNNYSSNHNISSLFTLITSIFDFMDTYSVIIINK